MITNCSRLEAVLAKGKRDRCIWNHGPDVQHIFPPCKFEAWAHKEMDKASSHEAAKAPSSAGVSDAMDTYSPVTLGGRRSAEQNANI